MEFVEILHAVGLAGQQFAAFGTVEVSLTLGNHRLHSTRHGFGVGLALVELHLLTGAAHCEVTLLRARVDTVGFGGVEITVDTTCESGGFDTLHIHA